MNEIRSNSWSIGSVGIDGRAVLAPMAGVSDVAYRLLAKENGAALVCTEMVSAMGIKYNNEKTKDLLFMEDIERPVSMQIFGSHPETMARGAQVMADHGVDIVDINMGCPVKKVVSGGDGSALMKTPDLAVDVARAVVQAVSIPVTVKMRLGWDENHKNVVDLARRMEDVGVAAVAVHGRTREQMYMGNADWSFIRAVKEALAIPVIGNGDVVDGPSAKRMLDETGCDAIMVGRGAQGNPWVFNEINAYLAGQESVPIVTGVEKMHMLLRHFQLLVKYKGLKLALREIRTHAGWYMKGLYEGAYWRNYINTVTTEDAFYQAIDEYTNILQDKPLPQAHLTTHKG